MVIRPAVWPEYTSVTGRTGQRSDSTGRTVFWATVRKTVCPMLSDRCRVCHVCDVGVLWPTVRRIKMKLGMQVGRGRIVLDGDPAPLPQRGTAPQFSAHICCGQMAAWIKIPLGMEVGLGPGDFVLHGDPVPLSPKRGRPMFIVANGWMDQV